MSIADVLTSKWATGGGAVALIGGTLSVAFGVEPAIGGVGIGVGAIALLIGLFGEKRVGNSPLPAPGTFGEARDENEKVLGDQLETNQKQADEEAEDASMDDVVDGVNDFLRNAPGAGPERPED